MVTGLKFRRLDFLGRQLGSALAERFAAELDGVDGITAVPLGWLRRLGRGYNQAEEIAATLAARCGKKRALLLERRRGTRPQSLATLAERQSNLLAAFAPTRALRSKVWQGSHVLLVDDVITTGATLDAAARCLLEAGVAEVTALVAARTPSPEEKFSL